MIVKINRKKQFASFLAPFYIIINMDQDKIKKAINNELVIDESMSMVYDV